MQAVDFATVQAVALTTTGTNLIVSAYNSDVEQCCPTAIMYGHVVFFDIPLFGE